MSRRPFLYTVKVFCQHSEYDSFLTNQSPYLKFHTTIAIVVRLFESRRLKMHNVFLSLIAYDSNLPPEVARCFHVCYSTSSLEKVKEPTSTLSSISSVSWWTGSTFISTGIGWCRKINALNPRVTRLTIHFAGVNVALAEPSCVSSLTCATHVYKLAVRVGWVTLFWLYALTIMFTGAHVNNWTPTGTCAFVVKSNESKVELQREISEGIKLLFKRVSSY